MSYKVRQLLGILVGTLILIVVGIMFGIFATRPGVAPKKFRVPQAERAVAPYGKVQEVYLGDAVPGPRTKNAIRIAILDSGFNERILKYNHIKLCPESFDATTGREEIGKDIVGHGTAMAVIAGSFAGESDYCIIGVKVFEGTKNSTQVSFTDLIKGVEKAASYKADIVALSFGGPGYDLDEREAYKKLGQSGPIVFVSAGNDHTNLTDTCVYYPACYKLPSFYVVGAQDHKGQPAKYSNYGMPVDLWIQGTAFGMQGTSVSTAIAAGSYAKFLYKKRLNRTTQ